MKTKLLSTRMGHWGYIYNVEFKARAPLVPSLNPHLENPPPLLLSLPPLRMRQLCFRVGGSLGGVSKVGPLASPVPPQFPTTQGFTFA